jgi:hypothetical protein
MDSLWDNRWMPRSGVLCGSGSVCSWDGLVGPLPCGRGDASVMFPIRVTGVPDGAIMHGESPSVRIITPVGQKQTNPLGVQMGVPLLRTDEIGKSDKPFTYALRVPRDLYARIVDQSVRVEIDYYLTPLKLADTQTLPATGGTQRTRGLGWCGAKISDGSGGPGAHPHRHPRSARWDLRQSGLLALRFALRPRRDQPLHRNFTVRKSAWSGHVPGEGTDAFRVAREVEDVRG